MTSIISDLNSKEVAGTFYEKELQRLQDQKING